MAKKPERKEGESTREYRARVSRWEAKQAGRAVTGAVRSTAKFLMSKPKAGKDKNMNLTAWRENKSKGVDNITGKKTPEKKPPTRKEGQRATLNGKPVIWKKGKWVPAPSRTWSKPEGAKGGGKPSEGDRSTWSNKKDEKPTSPEKTTSSGSSSSSSGSSSSSSSSSSRSSSSSTPPRRRTPTTRGQGPVKEGKTYGRLLRQEKTRRENERVKGETKEQLKAQGMSDRMAKALSGIKKWKE